MKAIQLFTAFVSFGCVTLALWSSPAMAWKRISAVTACHPTEGIGHTAGIGRNTITGISTNYYFTAGSTSLICDYPDDTAQPHEFVNTINIHGFHDGTNGVASYAQACVTEWHGYTYACGAPTYFSSNQFNHAVSSFEWKRTSPDQSTWFPHIWIGMGKWDKIYGFYTY